MSELNLYRKRLIPEECILLKDDVIIEHNDDIVATKWKVLKPRKDFDHGCSVYFLKEGFKVSKFCKSDGSLHYWYCDIITHEYDASANTLIVTDLLADVIIYPDGRMKVVDIGEMVEALDKNLVSLDQLKKSLKALDGLLEHIYSGSFEKYKQKVEEIE